MSADEKYVFVSHASPDKALVDEVVNLIDTGMKVPRDHIYHSSKRSLGTPAGDDFRNTVGKHLESAKIVIIVMTSNYMSRPYCLGEMGAAWAKHKRIFVLIVSNTSFDEVEGFLEPRDIGPLEDKYRLTELYKAVCAVYEVEPDIVNWEIERDAFLGKIRPIVTALPNSKFVTREELDKEIAVKNVLQQRLSRAQAEVEDQKRLINEIIDAKITAEQAQNAILENAPETEQFIYLCNELSSTIRNLPAIVSHAIRSFLDDESLDYREIHLEDDPSFNASIDRAIDEKYLIGEDDGDRYIRATPNLDIVEVENAVKSAQKLKDWLAECSVTIEKTLRNHYGFTPDLANPDFWKAIKRGDHIPLSRPEN